MCGPWVGIALAGAQMAQQSQGAAASAEFNDAVMARNEEIAKRAEADSLLYGAGAAGQAVESGSQAVAKARAMAAASGVDVGSEGVLSILETTREYAALDAETIKNNALREALGFSTQASSIAAQRRMAGIASEYQQKQIMVSGFGSIYNQLSNYGSFNRGSDGVPFIGSKDAPWYMGGGWDASSMDMAKGSE